MVGRFDSSAISSDGGALVLRKGETKTRIVYRIAPQVTDHYDPEAIGHSVRGLIGQRMLGLALRHEDHNDLGRLRHDPRFAATVGKLDPDDRAAAPYFLLSTFRSRQTDSSE